MHINEITHIDKIIQLNEIMQMNEISIFSVKYMSRLEKGKGVLIDIFRVPNIFYCLITKG